MSKDPVEISLMQQLVLASSSAFRQQLLKRLGIPFETSNPGVDEAVLPGETPGDSALRLARAKARAAASRYPQALIIGSDQVAVCDGHALGKPGNHDNAVRQLRMMRGRSVSFLTALCLLNAQRDTERTALATNIVTFRDLTDDEIERYLRREQPYDCAGSAKSEGLGIAMISRMQGDDPNALIGLPADRACRHAQARGRGRTVSARCGTGPGSLFLIPVPLGDAAPSQVLAAEVIGRVKALDYFVAEKAKSARAFLKAIGVQRPLLDIEIREIGADPVQRELDALLVPLSRGRDAGLISEAGCPGVADPGAALVLAAHRHHIRVIPMVGPSSVLLGLMAAGLNGQSFAFCGYLPIKEPERSRRIREIEETSRRGKQTQIFIETPFRNQSLFAALLQECRSGTLLAIARELTLKGEWIATKSVAEWRAAPPPDLARRPAVFLLLG